MAQTDYFLKVPGIEGESTDEAHGGEVELLSWSWGASNYSTQASATSGGGAGKASFQDIVCTMRTNKASPILFHFCASGKHITDEVVLTCRRAGEVPQDFFIIRMKNVYITTLQTGGNSNDVVPVDVFSLNYGAIKTEYLPQKEDGTLDAAVTAAYDRQRNKSDYPS